MLKPLVIAALLVSLAACATKTTSERVGPQGRANPSQTQSAPLVN